MQETIWESGLKFCGIKTHHNYYAIHLLSVIMENNPQVERIVEFGRSSGSLTINLGLIGVSKGIPVHSYDLEKRTSHSTDKILKQLGVFTQVIDYTNFMASQQIGDYLFNKPVYVIFNGNDNDEISSFVHHLFEESVVSVLNYDSKTESHRSIKTLKPFMEKEWNKKGVQLATWVKK